MLSVKKDNLNLSHFNSSRLNARLIFIIEEIQNSINFGRIARIIFSFNLNILIVVNFKSVKITKDVEKNSSGCVSLVSIVYTFNIRAVLFFFKKINVKVVGTSVKGLKKINSHLFTLPAVIIIGSEFKGISKKMLSYCDDIISIPIKYSINITDSISIFLYEVLRDYI